jgi:hypothetical protein
MQLVCLLTEDGSEAKTETSQTIWGQTKFEIVYMILASNPLFCMNVLPYII